MKLPRLSLRTNLILASLMLIITLAWLGPTLISSTSTALVLLGLLLLPTTWLWFFYALYIFVKPFYLNYKERE